MAVGSRGGVRSATASSPGVRSIRFVRQEGAYTIRIVSELPNPTARLPWQPFAGYRWR